jgi:hypothetical protein
LTISPIDVLLYHDTYISITQNVYNSKQNEIINTKVLQRHTMKKFTSLLFAFSLILSQSPVSAQAPVEDIINLTFSPSNAGDVANNPDVTNILSWVNGSTTVGITPTMPSDDFANGYAGLTVPYANFGYLWGFEGGFDTLGTVVYDVHSVSFDFDLLGHNGEAILDLSVGSWSGSTPLPSTVSAGGPIFGANPTNGTQATGSVTFDFLTNTLTVTRVGFSPYSTSFVGDLELNPGTHVIDILTSNTVTSNGAFDANTNAMGGANDAFYRIDNFRITGSAVPEPSSTITAALGLMFLLRRNRSRNK